MASFDQMILSNSSYPPIRNLASLSTTEVMIVALANNTIHHVFLSGLSSQAGRGRNRSAPGTILTLLWPTLARDLSCCVSGYR